MNVRPLERETTWKNLKCPNIMILVLPNVTWTRIFKLIVGASISLGTASNKSFVYTEGASILALNVAEARSICELTFGPS